MTGHNDTSAGTEHARHHDLKCWPEFFEALIAGKPFDLRNNDRDFRVGDELNLHEFDPATSEFSGRVLVRKVTYILAHRPDAGCAATWGLQPGYVILGIASAAQAKQVWPKEFCSLVNEIAGVWDAFEIGLRQEISNTNYAVVREKLTAAETLIASQPSPAATVETDFMKRSRELRAGWLEKEAKRKIKSDGAGGNQPEQRTGPHRASGETNSGATGDSELTRSARQPSDARCSAATDEVRCYGCGSAWTDAELIEARKSNPRLVSCCPERKPLDITAWMARAVAAEKKVRKLSEPQTLSDPEGGK